MRRLDLLLGPSFVIALVAGACATGTADTGSDDDDGSGPTSTAGVGGNQTGGASPTTVVGPGGASPTTTVGPGGAAPTTTVGPGGMGAGGMGTGGMGTGGMGGMAPTGTCDDWSLGALGAVGDHTGDIDVRYFEYRDQMGVIELEVWHAPFDPTVATDEPGIRLRDDGTNVIDMYWSGGAATFEASTDSGANFTTIAADPDLTIDVTDANVGGTITYTIPETLLATHLPAATVATEIHAEPFARTGMTFTDQVTTTTPNVRWTSRSQCNFTVASNPETNGDATDPIDIGAISYNAENGMLRLRIDYYTPQALSTQEAQVYVYDQSVITGFGIIVLSAFSGDLMFATRDDLFGFWSGFIDAPVSCTTNPVDLTAVTDFLEFSCPQADIQALVNAQLGGFVFNGAHTYRMAGLSWTNAGFEDDEIPNGWTTAADYNVFDLVDIP